jgi:hypothetical protein
MAVGSFKFQDREAAYERRQAAIDKYLNDREADQWYSSKMAVTGEGGVQNFEEITNQYRARKGEAAAYKQVVAGGEGGNQMHWVSTAPSGGGSCFIAGTLVRMADNSTRAIETVKAGEKVRSLYGDALVTDVEHVPLAGRALFGFDEECWFTNEHPFDTDQGWKAINGKLTENVPEGYVGDLQIGDYIYAEDGSFKKVEKIYSRPTPPEQTVYNLMLEDDHEHYYAGRNEDELLAVMD